MEQEIQSSSVLKDVRYEIRGQLANRAFELEKRGYEIISLNIGNPGLFGYRTPETMRHCQSSHSSTCVKAVFFAFAGLSGTARSAATWMLGGGLRVRAEVRQAPEEGVATPA